MQVCIDSVCVISLVALGMIKLIDNKNAYQTDPLK